MTTRLLAVVTGASSGIGREFALDYARRGYDLIVVARRERTLDELATEIQTIGVRCTVVAADLATMAGIESMLATIATGPVPDVVVLNAGVTLAAKVGTSSAQTINDLTLLLANGPIHVMERIAPSMAARGSGDIVVVSSIAARIPMPRSAIYAAAKAAVTSYARSVHRELRRSGVRVVAVNPGYVRTNLHRAAGLDHLEKVVPAWLWLEPRDVVESAHRALAYGRDCVVPGLIYRLCRPFLASDGAQELWRRLVRRRR